MADTLAQHGAPQVPGHGPAVDPGGEGGKRRDFLYLTTAAFTVVGVGALAVPFIASMNPSRDVLALASTEVDLSPIAVGSAVTIMWRGKPVFVRHRTAEEIQTARAVPLSELPDPAPDQSRVIKDQWLVLLFTVLSTALETTFLLGLFVPGEAVPGVTPRSVPSSSPSLSLSGSSASMRPSPSACRRRCCGASATRRFCPACCKAWSTGCRSLM